MAAHLWFIYALCASICWGIGYAISEKLLKLGITPAFMLAFGAIIGLPLYFGFLAYTGQFKPGLEIMMANKKTILLALLAIGTAIAGNFLILNSISEKNATLASLIEISYPIFTFLFVWLLFGQVQLTIVTALGAALIFAGVAVIMLNG